jgi:hypothetical protein
MPLAEYFLPQVHRGCAAGWMLSATGERLFKHVFEAQQLKHCGWFLQFSKPG